MAALRQLLLEQGPDRQEIKGYIQSFDRLHTLPEIGRTEWNGRIDIPDLERRLIKCGKCKGRAMR
jgi:hypothetical protein